MGLVPFPGTGASWKGAAHIHSVNLSCSPEQDDCIETGAGRPQCCWTLPEMAQDRASWHRTMCWELCCKFHSRERGEHSGTSQCSQTLGHWDRQRIAASARDKKKNLRGKESTPPFCGGWEHMKMWHVRGVLCPGSLAGTSWALVPWGGCALPDVCVSARQKLSIYLFISIGIQLLLWDCKAFPVTAMLLHVTHSEVSNTYFHLSLF